MNYVLITRTQNEIDINFQKLELYDDLEIAINNIKNTSQILMRKIDKFNYYIKVYKLDVRHKKAESIDLLKYLRLALRYYNNEIDNPIIKKKVWTNIMSIIFDS